MTANISYQGTDLDNIFENPILGAATTNRNYLVAGTDIAQRYTALANVSIANGNIAARIPPTGILLSNGTDLSSIFAGKSSNYSVTTLTTQSGATAKSIGATQTLTHQFTVTFASASALTNYFTYGGRILITASNTGGSGAADTALTNMFSSMGTFVVYDQGCYRTGAGGTVNAPSIGGQTIGAGFATLYTLTDGSPYGTSNYTIQMSGTGQNAGSVTTLTFICTLTLVQSGVIADSYTGTRTSQIQQRNYSGAVTPTQSAPTYATTTFNW